MFLVAENTYFLTFPSVIVLAQLGGYADVIRWLSFQAIISAWWSAMASLTGLASGSGCQLGLGLLSSSHVSGLQKQ
jgi:hypothetical protein